MTLARSGLDTRREVCLLECGGLRYNPDLVVTRFVLKDCDFYSRLAPARGDSEAGVVREAAPASGG